MTTSTTTAASAIAAASTRSEARATHRQPGSIARFASWLRAAVARTIEGGQLGADPEIEIGRHTGARI